MIFQRRLIFILGLLISSVATADGNNMKSTVSFQQLSLAAALEAAQTSLSECRKESQNVSVAVVDRSGLTQVVLRDTYATAISSELGRKKAYTAVNFLKNTTQLANLSDTAIGRSEGVLMSAGGVLIVVDDLIYGAIGVSGASSGAKDDACAKAGAKKIITTILSDQEEDSSASEKSQADTDSGQ